MATRANILVKVKDSDLGEVIKFDPSFVPGGYSWNEEFIGLLQPIVLEKNFIGIYHHWDSYPEGLGNILERKFNTYREVLNLMCIGDCSSICQGRLDSYVLWRGEDWSTSKPKQSDNDGDLCSSRNDYYYLFENGQWFYKSCQKDLWEDFV